MKFYVIKRASKNQYHSNLIYGNWSSHEINEYVTMSADRLAETLAHYGQVPDGGKVIEVEKAACPGWSEVAAR